MIKKGYPVEGCHANGMCHTDETCHADECTLKKTTFLALFLGCRFFRK